MRGLRVLIVDDEADARELLTAIIESRGAEVLAVASAAEALRSFGEFNPDIMLSDIGMPGEDGYTLIRKIRALGAEGRGLIPAIALTAYARDEDRARAIGEGYNLHLSKPANPPELIAAVESLAVLAKRS
jgi:CheY-like chemotaxis protein